jgi:hypothetical protein
MGNWVTSSKGKEGKQEKLIKPNNNIPKEPKYGIFKKPPDFYFLFGTGGIKNMHGDKNLMVKYEIVNEDLDKDNLALVFIDRIIKNKEIIDKKKALEEVKMKLFNISIRQQNSKTTLPKIIEAKNIIKDNLKKYEKQIDEKIKELQPNPSEKPPANSNAAAKPPANSNAPSIQPANPPAKPATNLAGGSSRRKKSKKLRS